MGKSYEEDWRAPFGAEETGIEAAVAGKEMTNGTDEEAAGKSGVEPATEISVMLEDPPRETWGTAVSEVCIEIPVKNVVVLDISQTAATVAAWMTRRAQDTIAEVIGEARWRGSTEEADETDKEITDGRLAPAYA